MVGEMLGWQQWRIHVSAQRLHCQSSRGQNFFIAEIPHVVPEDSPDRHHSFGLFHAGHFLPGESYYGCDDAEELFVNDFAAAWDKVINLDRFDLSD